MTRILVPLDGSSFAESALPAAIALTRKTGGELRILSVQEDLWQGDAREAALRWRRGYLARIGRGRGFFDRQVTTTVQEGSPEDAILDEAKDWGANLIVMTTHGRGAVTPSWLGGVADHCMRNASIPVLLIHPRPTGARPSDDSFVANRIVIPHDGSEGSDGALAVGSVLASILHASVELLGVVEDGETSNARARLEPEVARLRRVGHEATARIVSGRPAAAIVQDAGTDLVVMPTKGRHIGPRALLGSVTDKVIRSARGPVLAVPPEAWESSPALKAASPSFDDHDAA